MFDEFVFDQRDLFHFLMHKKNAHHVAVAVNSQVCSQSTTVKDEIGSS